jgi:predicted small lipoprotein YifL
MKGPERLDRVSYPPIVLEPSDVARDESGTSWTYHAKDSATGAVVSVKLFREACSDTMADMKFTFRVSVEHAQIGTLNGCGQSVPESFPEFRKKNQLDPADDPDANTNKDKDKDKDKNSALEPITKFTSPVATAYLDATGKVIVSRGELKKTAAPAGYELALSHDGKKLLYTRDLAGADRTIVLYDVDSGRSQDLITGLVHQAFWSPDDSRVAFLKIVDQKWQVWSFPVSAPDKAAAFSPQTVLELHGWASPSSVLASDMDTAFWLGEDGKALRTVPLKAIYGDTFQIMSSDTVRINPVNPDLLLVSAFYNSTPPGAPVDSMGLNSSFFLYEVRSKRRVILCPTDTWARSAEWSCDGLQIYFSRKGVGNTFSTNRIFWDGSGLKRYSAGNALVIGK